MSISTNQGSDIRTISTDKAPMAAGPYAQAIAYGNMLYVSGQLPINPKTLRVEEPLNAVAQTHQIFENITEILAEAGGSLPRVLKATVYLTRIEDFPEVNSVYGTYFKEAHYPARSCIVVTALPHPDAVVEIEVIATTEPKPTALETAY